MVSRHLGSVVTRRALLATTAAVLARPAVLRASPVDTLRFIPQADITILDPLATTAYVTRNHGHLCWDTLYGADDNFVPSPQLAEGHSIEDDGKRWLFTLRDGPTFHDGEKVRATDAVASIRRWMPHDTYGQVLAGRLDAMRALDDRRFELRLQRPFPLLLDALAKATSFPCFIYPERFAAVDPAKPFTEVVGSGPYRFVADERVAGARAVYRKYDRYSPTPVGTPSLIAGPKLASFERLEWNMIPDGATAAAALRAGEMDWWEGVASDLDGFLAQATDVVLDQPDRGGAYAALRFNSSYPPFNDPVARRAVLKAVKQADFMIATAGADQQRWRDGVGCFPGTSPFASDEGMEALTGPRDLDAAKAALAAAGYKGAPVVALHATDVPNQNALMSVAVDVLKQLGFAVTDLTSDWGTVLQRRGNKAPPDHGGWNVLVALFSASECSTPAGNLLLRANGADAWYGWPNSPRLEELRTAWFDAADEPGRRAISRQIQAQFFIDLPYVPLGQYFTHTAYRRGLTGVRRGIVLPLNAHWS
ncbi:MAG: ABC transporter substrate-binding protein [Alphaproteobacteria bacterium]|nr:ABC transporter substrate-binding protein [Alphaproteobacteria bacterium]